MCVHCRISSGAVGDPDSHPFLFRMIHNPIGCLEQHHTVRGDSPRGNEKDQKISFESGDELSTIPTSVKENRLLVFPKISRGVFPLGDQDAFFSLVPWEYFSRKLEIIEDFTSSI